MNTFLRRGTPIAAVLIAAGVILTTNPWTALSQTNVWTVDNNLSHAADFRDLQEAFDSPNVISGHTLHIAGSQTPYGGAVLRKQLTIYGPGYLLRENEQDVNSFAETRIGGLEFFKDVDEFSGTVISTSAGSRLSGLVIGNIDVHQPMISFERCHLQIMAIQYDPGSEWDGSNTTLLQCFAPEADSYIIIVSGASNVVVANSYLASVTAQTGCNDIVIQNNVIHGSISAQTPNSLVANNIFTFSSPAGFTAAGQVKNNMVAALTSATYLPAGNGNTNGVNQATVFVGSGTPDGKWQLQDGSPASGTGMNGVDMGMFALPTPYVLSGIPAIPTVVVDSNPTGTGLQGLQIKVRATSRN